MRGKGRSRLYGDFGHSINVSFSSLCHHCHHNDLSFASSLDVGCLQNLLRLVLYILKYLFTFWGQNTSCQSCGMRWNRCLSGITHSGSVCHLFWAPGPPLIIQLFLHIIGHALKSWGPDDATQCSTMMNTIGQRIFLITPNVSAASLGMNPSWWS